MRARHEVAEGDQPVEGLDRAAFLIAFIQRGVNFLGVRRQSGFHFIQLAFAHHGELQGLDLADTSLTGVGGTAQTIGTKTYVNGVLDGADGATDTDGDGHIIQFRVAFAPADRGLLMEVERDGARLPHPGEATRAAHLDELVTPRRSG